MGLYWALVEYVLIMTKHFYTQKKIKFAIKSKKRKKRFSTFAILGKRLIGGRMKSRIDSMKIGWEGFASHKPPKGSLDKPLKVFSAGTFLVPAGRFSELEKLGSCQLISLSTLL
jgi:hypothetical protein